jgi:hypothetical protein
MIGYWYDRTGNRIMLLDTKEIYKDAAVCLPVDVVDTILYEGVSKGYCKKKKSSEANIENYYEELF